MPVSSGARLGPYEIVGQIGAGGMGEVYRAKDTRLDRMVAIKVLPTHLSSQAELKQRFEREARAISSLSHPHICALYDIGHQDGVDYLVMEFLEGETLAQRLNKGALSTELVLRYGIQIADALDKAHKQGIVHRDLKPGNIMLTKSGIKLLDFGLAKLQAATSNQFMSGVSALPTEQRDLTAQGTILGTIQYMSPEQLEGRESDARTDIFALGAVLYEMATGKKAFTGKSQASLIAAILSSEPQPITAIQPMTPAALERLVKTCLAKDPEDRWQTAHDVMLELRSISEGLSQPGTQTRVIVKPSRERLAWAIASLAILSLLAFILFFRIGRKETSSMRFVIPPPENMEFNVSTEGCPPVLAPNGHAIAFCAVDEKGQSLLWVQPVGSLSAKVLAGTEGATFPFWSSDSKSIGFFAGGKLKTIEANGGPTLSICEAPRSRGGTWSGEVILFTPDFSISIQRVSATGGKPEPITKIDPAKHSTHRWPYFLPDGKHFLYLAASHERNVEYDGIYFASLDGKENHLVIRTNSNAIFASNHLLFLRGTDLIAQRFDPQKGEIEKEPAQIAQNVHYDLAAWRGYFAASQDGKLLYQTRGGTGALNPTRLKWYDRTGKEIGTLGEEDVFFESILSKDGNKAAVTIGDPGEIFIYDLVRGNRTPAVRSPRNDISPVWAPDGKYLAYGGATPGENSAKIYMRSSDWTGEEKLLVDSQMFAIPTDWSPDSKFLIFTQSDSDTWLRTQSDILILPLQPITKPIPLLTGPSLESDAQFSPDGKWIAYTSTISGSTEVYIIPFDPENPEQARFNASQISTSGGSNPEWRGDGLEIFYVSPDRTLMSATIEVRKNKLEAASVQPLFKMKQKIEAPSFSVTSDGKRFLINTVPFDKPAPITLILNWLSDLK
jgi:serine/threonine protein kinase